MNPPVIRLHNVRKSYGAGSADVLDVLRGVSLEVEEGEIVAVVGSSGAGKSTLLHVIGALDRPSDGTVEVGGVNMFTMGDTALAAFRNANVGFVFQFHHLLPEFSALENVAMPALIGGAAPAEATRRATELLEMVRVAHRAHARPSELSGGEQQRVAVARALVNAPRVVLADEPSGNLDEENAAMLHDLLWSLAAERRQTIVVVTHDQALARRAHRMYRLHEGRLAAETAAHTLPT
jgi:lipoprotein-releasing system ATP-binding protein